MIEIESLVKRLSLVSLWPRCHTRFAHTLRTHFWWPLESLQTFSSLPLSPPSHSQTANRIQTAFPCNAHGMINGRCKSLPERTFGFILCLSRRKEFADFKFNRRNRCIGIPNLGSLTRFLFLPCFLSRFNSPTPPIDLHVGFNHWQRSNSFLFGTKITFSLAFRFCKCVLMCSSIECLIIITCSCVLRVIEN